MKSPKLSKTEIQDIKIAEEEIRQGKCKTFNTVKELLEDLHENREKKKEPK